jgi:hypothetical protein
MEANLTSKKIPTICRIIRTWQKHESVRWQRHYGHLTEGYKMMYDAQYVLENTQLL